MTHIKMIAEDEATGKTKEIYEDIKQSLKINFVPNMYKVMASKPGFFIHFNLKPIQQFVESAEQINDCH